MGGSVVAGHVTGAGGESGGHCVAPAYLVRGFPRLALLSIGGMVVFVKLGKV